VFDQNLKKQRLSSVFPNFPESPTDGLAPAIACIEPEARDRNFEASTP
jgi:hypothetical protein